MNNWKKVGTWLVSMITCVSLLCGCTLFGGRVSSMWDVARLATQLETYTATTEMTAYINDVKYSVTISERCDGNATAMDASLFASGVSVSFSNVLVVTEDVCYLNMKEVLHGLSSISTLLNVDLSGFQCNRDWICLKADGLFKKDQTLIKSVLDGCETYFNDLVTKQEDTYVLNCEDATQLKNVLTKLTKMISDNQKDWAETMVESYSQASSLDLSSFEKEYAPLIEEAFAKRGFLVTQESLQNILNVKLSELEASMDAQYGDQMDALDEEVEAFSNTTDYYIHQMERLVSRIEEFMQSMDEDEMGNYKATLKAAKKDTVYTFELEGEAQNEEEKFSVHVLSTILDCKPEAVTVPTDAMEYSEYMPTFIDASVELLLRYLGSRLNLPTITENESTGVTIAEETVCEIGTDLTAGLYVLVADSALGATYTVVEDGEEIDWDYFTYDVIIELEEGQNFGYSNATLYARDQIVLETNTPGMYQVGVDLAPGNYTLEISEGKEFVSYKIYEGVPRKDYSNYVTSETYFAQVDSETPSMNINLTQGQFITIEGGCLQ